MPSSLRVWPSSKCPIRHGCQWRACSLVNFNQRLTAGCQGSTSFPFRTEQVVTERSSLSAVWAIRHPPAITALLIAPRCSRRDAQAPRLMFNVATPRINACLRKTRHADCWIVPSDSWRKEVSHLSSIREGRMYYLVNWLRRGSKLGAFFSAELFKLSLMLIAGEGGQLVSLWLTLGIPWRL